MPDAHSKPILVLGANGKTGRRVTERLTASGRAVRAASRSSETWFDWQDETTWAPALNGVEAVYITYYPDLAFPGAADTVGTFADLAVASGVKRLVLLSGRGEEAARQAGRCLGRQPLRDNDLVLPHALANMQHPFNILPDNLCRRRATEARRSRRPRRRRVAGGPRGRFTAFTFGDAGLLESRADGTAVKAATDRDGQLTYPTGQVRSQSHLPQLVGPPRQPVVARHRQAAQT